MRNWTREQAQQWERLSQITPDLSANFRERIVTAMTASSFVNFDSIKVVKTAADFENARSDIEYWLDGTVDLGAMPIVAPVGGLNIRGFDFDISKLTSSAPNYTMFTSPVGGSGNILGADYAIEVTGANSQVYDLVSDTGFEAFEFARINYNNCTSLGKIDNYRQGLEFGTGRFGGQPSLELVGIWVGGYRITTSIVRNIDNAMTEPLFKAGAGFMMESRFLTDINADMGTLAPFTDFAPSNFPNPSTFQIHGAIFTRNGVSDAEDATILPNIASGDLSSDWWRNQGVMNTFVGGVQTTTVEIETEIDTMAQFEDLLGTFAATDLQHFDVFANGQLRHLGKNPREFRIFGDFTIDGTSNDELVLKVVRWDNSIAGFVDVYSQLRPVNSLAGGRNVAFFSFTAGVTMDENDYIKLMIANNSGTANVTAELDGSYTVLER